MNLHLPAAIVAALVPFAAALQAQHDPAPAAPAEALPWPEDRAFAEVGADGTVAAAGAMWKAAFASNTATFTPCLGGAVPSQPVQFRLAAVWIGAASVPFDDAMPALHGQRVDFERGSLREFYALRAGGIEQQFAFAALPARGELRLDVAVATDLQVEQDADGFLFRRAEGGVRYGRATAIDALGRRLELATHWTGGALQIVVPAAFVEAAELPLLIDPMIGAVTALPASTAALSSPDMAFDRTLGQYFACYERAFSATDHDVYVACYSASMQFQWLVTIDFTAAYWSKPRIAVLEASDVACVVAETSTGNAAPFAISARRFTGGQAPVLHPVQTVDAHPLQNRRDPDIGGDAAPSGNSRFLVVFESLDSSINDSILGSVLIDAAGVRSGSGNLSTPIDFVRRPRVSKTCGMPGGGTEGWAIVYRAEFAQQSDGWLRTVFVDRNGMHRWVNGAAFVDISVPKPNLGSEWDVSSPSDHAAGRMYLCVERRYEAATGTAGMVLHLFDRVGWKPVGVQGVPVGNHDNRSPAVDCDGVRFAVAHAVVLTPTDVDVHVYTFRYHQFSLDYDEMAYAATSFDRETEPALCASPGVPNLYGMAWVHAVGATSVFETRLYRGIAAGGFAQRATGCGGLGIQATGIPAIGETIVVSIQNPSGLTGFVAGAPTNGVLAACPGCTQGANGTTLLGSSLPIAIPASAAFVGLTLAVQGFRFEAAGQPCLGQIALSNTLDFTIQ